jgi:ABC-2 type transport system permease protein
MHNLKRTWAIFWFYSGASFKIIAQQRAAIILFTFGKLVRFALFGFFVYHLLSRSELLAGYTLTETMIFFLTYNVIDSLTQLVFRQVYRFRPLVITGQLDLILVKPYHPFLRVLIGGVDILDIVPSILSIGLLSYFVFQLDGLTLWNVAIYLVLLLNAFVLATSFHIIVLALGILTTGVDHTVMIYRDISRMAALPIDIYREPLRTVLTFVIPVGLMISFPVKALVGVLSLEFILFSIVFSGILFMLSFKTWHYALQKYQSAGG